MTYRILKLHADNVMRLRAVDITPEEDLVVIAGQNDAGKSSLLASIQMALGGKRYSPDVPLRSGARNGSVKLELGDGKPTLIVNLKIGKDGKQTLQVTDEHGDEQRSPMALLNSLIDAVAFEPLSLASASPRELADMLRKAVGLDFSVDDRTRQSLYDQRRDVNAGLKTATAHLSKLEESASTLPEVIPNVDELRSKVEASEKLAAEEEKRQRRIESLKDKAKQLESEIAVMRQRLEMAVQTACKIYADLANLEGESGGDFNYAALHELRRELEDAVVINHAAKVLAEIRKQQAVVKTWEAKSQELTDAIESIDASKNKRLAEAPWPVAGLGFDEDGTITLDGLPLSQASQSARLNAVVGIVASMNSKLRVMLVRDASVLGDERLEQLRQIARERGMQIWAEYATRHEGDKPSVPCIVIEDGSVADEESELSQV